MCARRFLGLIFVLTLLIVAGAFAIYQWGGRALVQQAVPKGRFEPPPQGGAPVYRDPSLWVARPGTSGDPSLWLPGEVTDDGGARRAAVFYIHPTTYLERERWNAPFVADAQTEFRTRLFVESQASAFNGAGQVWAPRYRQAAYGAFLLNSSDAQKALAVAYQDVEAAFTEFLSQVPEDQPIILAGHSQGALHLERLLQRQVAGKPIARRIVAAYVVGWPIDVNSDLPALGLPSCAAPDQTGCILSWMSFRDPANPELILDQWTKTRGLNGGERRDRDVLCVNPITGTTGSSGRPAHNPGTLVPTANLASARLEPGRVGARCERGLLIVEGEIPPLGPFVLPGNNYHVFDYALFWGAIRRDAERRTAAWQR
ncbi:MAG TPA: DUF3089 domain-containing protein [Sphingomicrobium sp.]|nr:DUF3089 domain-containing protein [Sphingomicrobium sp.]